MKIIIFTSFYGSGYGLGYSAYKEANEFCRQGHDVTVVYANETESSWIDTKVRTIYLPKVNMAFVDVADYFFKLRKFSTENKLDSYDIVYIQSLEFGLLDFTKINVPVFYFCRSTMKGISACSRKYDTRTRLVKKLINVILIVLEQRLFRFCHRVFVKSNLMAAEVGKFYDVPPEKIVVIAGGIDTDDFKKTISGSEIDNFRERYKIKTKDQILVYAGRIVPQKGLIYLIRALVLLKNDIDLMMLVAGSATDPLYRDSIMKFILANGLTNKIKFLGYIDQFDMFKLLNLASIVISPSLYEPFGMINLQAAFLNKAIITTKSVGANEILNDYNKMVVVEPASPSALARGIKEIIMLGEVKAGYNFRNYLWRCTTHKILDIFQQAV